MKKIASILLKVILSGFGLLLLLYLLLWLPPVQQKIKNFALQEILKRTKNQIQIGNLRFTPFNHLQLENVFVSDLRGDTLLYAGNFDAGFNLFKLLNNKLLIHSAKIDNFTIRIFKDHIDSPLNFQFLIDAFASGSQSPNSSAMQIKLNKVILQNGDLSYHVLSEPYLADNLFDVNHISIQNLRTTIHLQFTDLENLKTNVVNLSFTEKSGFKLDDLHFSLQSTQKLIFLNELAVKLPRSELEIDHAKFDYTGLNIQDIFTKAGYSFQSLKGKISPNDLGYFFPPLSNFPDVLSFSGKLEGQFPELNIPFLTLNYGENFLEVANVKMSDLYNWKKSTFAVQIKTCSIDEISEPVVLTKVDLTGNITGSLPDLRFNLQGKSELGDLTLQGTGGYMLTSGNINFDLNTVASNLNVRHLLSDNAFGIASFRASTRGEITGDGKIDANLNANISRFDYQEYSYQNVSINANYIENNVRFNLRSKDKNLRMDMRGNVNLSENNQEATLQANIHEIRLDSLNLLPEYPDAKLSGLVNAHIKGFNPEATTVSVAMDRFMFSTQSGTFSDSPITLVYSTSTNNQKQLNVHSNILNLNGKGEFTFDGINRSIRQTVPFLFPEKTAKKQTIPLPEENFNVLITIHQANTISRLLGMGTEIPDSVLFIGKYSSGDSLVNFDATVFSFLSKTDTSKLHLNLLSNHNDLAVRLNVNNRSAQYNLVGNMGAEIDFIPNPKCAIPDIHIDLNPGSISLNGTAFQIDPAQINIRDKEYEIRNFALRHSSSEYLKINGIISENRDDSLLVDINRFEIKTILSALNNDIPLSGSASGEISFSRLLSAPLVITRNFTVDNIMFGRDTIGNLSLTSGWSSARQGLLLRATLSNPTVPESVISGFVLPERDTLALTGTIQGLQLKWFADYGGKNIYDLGGEFGAKIRIDGKISNPILAGTAYLKNAKVGITQLNTMYHISDSIDLQPDKIVFKDFTIYDTNQRTGKINGTINHRYFSNLNPQLTIDFNNFLVLDNAQQTDSLFFGQLNVNGRLNVSLQNNNCLVQGNLTHGRHNSVMANLPETTEAQRYSWITFVSNEKEDIHYVGQNPALPERSGLSLPIRLNITLSVNPSLSAGVVYNPSTRDIAQVQGNGTINLSYDLNNMNMSLQGTYTVEDGECTFSLRNITRKTFRIQNSSKLVFRGDPMNTSFDLTAIYNLRTSLTALDPSFAGTATAGQIPVNCLLTVNGTMKGLQLQYQILLPNEPPEIQRRLDGLLYSDDIRIKQIAYLLAFGTFMPVNSGIQLPNSSNIWASIASSSVNSQLNNLLSGVLSDNWTIGTYLHSRDGNMSNLDMDVNISTRLFNDRLEVSGTLGYHNDLYQSNQTDNFTSDFDLEYKLSPGGNIMLRFFNITNNQFYERARMTQGVGILYRRQGKTFEQLFRSFRTVRRIEESK